LPYIIEYSPEAEEHLQRLTARQRKIVLDTVDRQLLNQPNVETKNRKPMRPNPVAPWELRIGSLACIMTLRSILHRRLWLQRWELKKEIGFELVEKSSTYD
jgi:mRNA-degrading endonuclease RelE of RelBE toxin-antitoxin system